MLPRLRFTLSLVALAAAIAPAGAHAATSARVSFPGNVLPLGRATDLGRTSARRVMEIGIGLKHPDAAGETQLAAAQQNPASPQYHRWLTPSAYAARFGVARGTFDRVLAWLRAGGATVQTTSSARDYVEISATVAQVDRLFQTEIHDYAARGTHFVANRYSPSVPAGLDVLTIMGLNTLVRPTTPLYGHGSPSAVQTGELAPQDLWSIYDMPSNNFGDGQSVAVIGEGQTDTVVKALVTFEDHHKLPHVPATVTRAPSEGDYSDTGGNIEWELDTQAATGMAPDVSQVHLYFGQHLIDPDVESAFTAWVNDPTGPRQANASFGECETTPANAVLENPLIGQFNNDGDPHAMFGSDAPNALEPVAEQTLRQANLEGRTLFASTGDTGSSCPVLVLGPLGAGNGIANEGAPLPNYPAASQYAVAVGGSVLYSDGNTPPKRGLEYPWPYTGGGQSYFITEPPFQQGVANINRPCVSDPDGNPTNTGQTCRGVPDVADESGDIATSGYTIYSPELGGDSSEGGTSLSSPLMVGMWARIQAAAQNGTGFADTPIYAVGKDATKYARDFDDLQVGTNGFYPATPGWDYVSGWGVPDLTNLMKDVAGGTDVVRAATNGTDAAGPAPSGSLIDQQGNPTAAGTAAGVTSAASACPKASVLTYHVHGHGSVRVVRAQIYVGKRLVKTVRGKRLTRVSIRRPSGVTRFTVRIVTTLSSHGHVTSSRSYTGCTRTKVVHKAKHAAKKKRARR